MPPLSDPSVPPPRKKTIVTEEALYVSPDVLGLSLARPWRRLAAILVDVVLVSILAREFGVFFGFVAAYVLFRVSFRPTPAGSYLKRSFRFMLRLGGALMLFVGVAVLWDAITDRLRGEEEGEDDRSVSAEITLEDGDEDQISVTGMAGLRVGADMVALTTADDEEEARTAATRLLASMRNTGASGAQARQTIREVAGSLDDRPWVAAAVEPILAADEGSDPASAPAEAVPDTAAAVAEDSVILAYGAALAAGDSASAGTLRPRAVAVLAADTVAALGGEIDDREREITELAEELSDSRERVEELETELEAGPGVLNFLRAMMEDLGLGLGWFGLYFTATTAMWQGRTPGKRLFGIRVIRLTGKPIGWWASFERFGGYAAGFATGLLGFAQVLWDDNRQAIHDKIAVTAVIRDPPKPSP